MNSIAIFVAAELGVVHLAWKAGGGCPSEVMAGYGATLGLIGLAVVGVPMFRRGAIDRATAAALPQDPRPFLVRHDAGASARRNALIREVRATVKSERIVAAVFIAGGTALNGYSGLITRHLGFVGAC